MIRQQMTVAELLALPATVDLETAGRTVGTGRTKAHELARLGEFPVPVLKIGSTYRVSTQAILDLLGIERPPPGTTASAP